MALSVLSEIRAGVAVATLAATDSHNALDAALVRDLTDALRTASADPGCRAIVLRATGAHFCRGVDLAAAVHDRRADPVLLHGIADCFLAIARAPQPVIACVEGHATGGGVGLVAACDLVLASQDATFTLSEAIVGMIPALITPLLLRRMAPGRARYMALSTRAISAAEARDFGLVDAVAPASAVQGALRQQLQRILHSSPRALADIKRYIDSFAEVDLETQLQAALRRLLSWLDDDTVVDGVGRFAAGEAPAWFQRYEAVSRV
jgi:methylglutaconyl-CoA hydratase/polyketide biosynthesis enoyl-CoA hydratase PksH